LDINYAFVKCLKLQHAEVVVVVVGLQNDCNLHDESIHEEVHMKCPHKTLSFWICAIQLDELEFWSDESGEVLESWRASFDYDEWEIDMREGEFSEEQYSFREGVLEVID
jgi:hypothetical protein